MNGHHQTYHQQQQWLLEQHQRLLEQQHRRVTQQCSRRSPSATQATTTAEVSPNRVVHHTAELPPPPPPPPPSTPKHRPRIIHLDSEDALSAALAADGYRLGSTVGHGSYSKVRLAFRTVPVMASASASSTARVACKVINKRRDPGTSSYVRKFLPRELEVLRTVRHPNVVRTHRIYVTPYTVYVFMDYCENGDLLSHLQHVKSIPQWQAHTFFRSVPRATHVQFFRRLYFTYLLPIYYYFGLCLIHFDAPPYRVR